MMAAVYSAEFRLLGRRRRKTKGTEGAKAGLERILDGIEVLIAARAGPASR